MTPRLLAPDQGDGGSFGVGSTTAGLGEEVRAELAGVGDGGGVQKPGRNGSCVSPPQPMLMPDGWLNQSWYPLDGSPLMKRRISVWPTLSPNARISPPP